MKNVLAIFAMIFAFGIASAQSASYQMSNQIVNNNEGIITDNGGLTEHYTNDENAIFTISPENAQYIILEFTDWALEAGYDFLYIYDGTDISSPLIGRYSTLAPHTIVAENGAITLRFVADEDVNGAGWVAEWTTIQFADEAVASVEESMEPTTYAMENNIVTETIGWLADSDFVEGSYANDENAIFTILPENTDRITLEFTDWALEAGYDFLYIYDGASTTAPLIGRYSATSPGTIVANSGALTLRFTSDENVNDMGWKAQWISERMDKQPVYPTTLEGDFLFD